MHFDTHNGAEQAAPPLADGLRAVLSECMANRAPVIRAEASSERRAEPASGLWCAVRVLMAPVVREDDVVAVFAVQDRSADYAQLDARTLECFADAAWGLVELGSAERERRRLQRHLEQAQKLECLGHLAAGIAHDFNNMLSVILGHAQLLLEESAAAGVRSDGLREIEFAATRSADLASRMLGFARPGVIRRPVQDLNEGVGQMLRILRRLIPGSVEIKWEPAPGLWPVDVDSGHLDQVLVNLVLNAADAISGSGDVRISTANLELEEVPIHAWPAPGPGAYVKLSVEDTGCGMDERTAAHALEPFFTTKVPGKGTGLGLSTVFRIVTRNHGFLTIESAVGRGAAFHVHLPRYPGAQQQITGTHAAGGGHDG